MDKKALERAYKKVADLYQAELKDKIKTGPTRAYKTGDLYNSVSYTLQPIEGGESIAYSLNYYGEYVNDGTGRIEPREFIEAAEKSKEAIIQDVIGDAAVVDIMVEFDKQLD